MKLFTIWDIVNTLDIEHLVTALRQLSFADSAFKGGSERMDQGAIGCVCDALEKCVQPFYNMGFKTSAGMMASFLDSAGRNIANGDWTASQFSEKCHWLFKAIQSETIGVLCLKLEDGHGEYLDKKHPYGEVVSNAFPDFSEDIEEAHSSFALERYTACVFHIGRVMELAVAMLAMKLKCTKCKQEWQPWLNAINERISKMPFRKPKQKEKRSHYSEASAYLFNFKEAWRNKTMHPKKTYTKNEARIILDNAGEFLKVMSERIFN